MINENHFKKKIKNSDQHDNGDVNGASKTGVLKNGLVILWKITPSDARNSQQLFLVEKT